MKSAKPEARLATVAGHLDELRSRIIRSALYIAGGTLLGLFFSKSLLALLKWPARDLVRDFVLLKPTDVIAVYMKAAVYAGVVVSAPLVLREAWLFVKPALPAGPRVGWAAWIAAAVLLFAGGTVFSFLVLAPAGLGFLLRLTQETATPLISLNSYLSLVLAIVVSGGIMFEMPVAAALLTRVGLITPAFLRKKWKEAVFGMLVLAAVVTPTTDVFNLLLFAVPMLLLYAGSILVSGWVYRQAHRALAIQGGYPDEA
jgi:sec-independent protein translocase protein TatC